MMSTKLRVERRDRPWRETRPALVIGPFDTPPVEAIQQAIARLADAHPQSRFSWRIDESGRKWVADRRPEDMVVEEAAVPGNSIADILDTTWSRHGNHGPLTFVRYPNHLALGMVHAVGDGRSFLEYLGGVAHTAFTGEVAPWALKPYRRFPLLTAGLRTFGRHPSMIRTAFADKFAPDDPATSGAVLPWRPARRSAMVAFPRERSAEMVEWGRRFNPAPSRFILLTSALLRAMREAGIGVSPDILVLMDLRKYLDAGAIDGNFIAGVPMRFGPDMTPQEFAASVRTTLRSGRPLANQILSSMRAGGFGYRGAQQDSYDPERPITLTVSDMGESACLDDLPFFEGGPKIYATCGPPDGPYGVTVALTHTQDSTIVTASFHENVVDPGQMQRALEILAAGPARLVCDPKLVR